MALELSTNVKALHGVGAARAAAYGRLGIFSLGDLLAHYPSRYEDKSSVTLLGDAPRDIRSAFILTVATEPKATILKGRLSILKFKAYDASGICEITYFNRNFLKNVFTPGLDFRFYGKAERRGKNFVMSSPEYELYSDSLPPISPIYPLTEGLTQKQLSKDMGNLINTLNLNTVADHLPEEIRIRNSLCTLPYALNHIHRPDSFTALTAARKRLIFDEFFTFALGISMAKIKRKDAPASPCPDGDISPLLSLLPYELTDAQKRVISEIKSDMAKDVAMGRIIVGDVGCGKTICAAAAIYIAVKNGKQAALMVPTEILAIQHYNDLSALLSSLGISCALLTSSVRKPQKQKIYDALRSEDSCERINVVIGTQALISESLGFYDLGLVVTDEQHRFGVNQRATLSKKSGGAHTLVMSATPIPRTMALALYGDLDLSLINQMPPGRQKVDTFAVNESYRERLNAFIEKQVAEGGQVYIVCPAVEETDEDGNITDEEEQKRNMKTAVDFSEQIAARFPSLRVAYMHGKLKAAQKEAIMKSFAEGDTDILVSTTVIEVGVNVPNASLMIVENAERFGLSQLHQLRGRVGRGKRRSYCVLVSDAEEGNARQRLDIMKSTYDGYLIAEKDLQMRGPGDFFRSGNDIRQSGGIKFRLAELCDDTGLLNTAFAEAKTLCADGKCLSDYPSLKESVDKMFTLSTETIN